MCVNQKYQLKFLHRILARHFTAYRESSDRFKPAGRVSNSYLLMPLCTPLAPANCASLSPSRAIADSTVASLACPGA